MKFLNVLKELNIGTDADTWIRGLPNVRKATKQLHTHCHVTSEGAI